MISRQKKATAWLSYLMDEVKDVSNKSVVHCEKLVTELSNVPEYINKREIHVYLKSHMVSRMNFHNELCLALTFELWLQQIFQKKYRDLYEY